MRILLLFLLLVGLAHAADSARPRFKAVAFDCFVIFDASSVGTEAEKVFPGKGAEFARAWRSKQFEYGFLRSITGVQEDFFKVTGDALDFTAEQMHLALTPETRRQLLNAYLALKPWPDSEAGLKRLKAAGVRIITISNFSADMLRANADRAGLTGLFDELLSTEVNDTYKPEPRAYQLGLEHLQIKKEELCYAAFDGWDAYGAKKFGYTTVWVNRFHLPLERLGTTPDRISPNMDGLVDLVLGGAQK
ncbi:MAG TPA: haloacid dehalogenase type II [Terriglobales bacterium]|nr:haloacid dehalogenase type II [Terriglobales bacterium]